VVHGERLEAAHPGPEVRLGIALRRAREGSGISLRALARRLHRAHSTLVEYERGHRLAPIDVIEAYEAELGVPAGTLVALHERARMEIYGADRSRRHTYVLKPGLAAPHQLPPNIAHFTGRAVELSRLRALVAQRRPRTVVTLVIAGAPGMGKTALAVHLAHELAPDFPDAQLYVNLHGYEPAQRLGPSQVLDRFLRALSGRAEVLPADLEEQAASFRGLLVGRRALLVLDNASSPEQVRPLIPATPSCVLITSRDLLAGMVATEGAQLLPLDVLAPGEALELLGRSAGAKRVKAEPDAAAEVVRLCGYLPLAVRIAGARLATRPAMRVATLVERLADERSRLTELSAGDVGVRASFAFSYQALSPGPARMFRRLGLVPGPDFACGVAAALTGQSAQAAESDLEALVDTHLLDIAPAPGRYRLHDLLRLYAREQAQAEETAQDRQDARRRMIEWYLDTADAAEQLLIPGRRRLPYEPTGRWGKPAFDTLGQALAWFELERASLVAVINEAAACGLHSFVWQLSDALLSFFLLRSHWGDWQATHRAGLAAAQEAGERLAEAWMMVSLGQCCRILRQFDQAADLNRRGLKIFGELGNADGQARALTNLGRDYVKLRRFSEAVDCLRQSLVTLRETDYPHRRGVALHYLGEAYRELHRFEEAVDCYQRSLAIRRALGNRWDEGGNLCDLGQAYRELQRFEEAADSLRESLAIAREVGDRWGEGRSLELLGLVVERTYGIQAALGYWREALAIFSELGDPRADKVRSLLATPSW
jgi:tetratricopeptide (TPR) repeat protein/transcriptional regulator with XRE-family HTH domain